MSAQTEQQFNPVVKSEEHEWVPAPNRSWDMCAKCGFIRRADGKNKPCKGSVRILPRRDSDI